MPNARRRKRSAPESKPSAHEAKPRKPNAVPRKNDPDVKRRPVRLKQPEPDQSPTGRSQRRLSNRRKMPRASATPRSRSFTYHFQKSSIQKGRRADLS